MPANKIVIIQGQPDGVTRHFGHALADAYAEDAGHAGHEVKIIEVAQMDFPVLRSQSDWTGGMLAGELREAQEKILWADHIVIVFPLWLGTLSALL